MSLQPELGLQKVCDIHDFFVPEIDRILRKELESVPFGSRRAWEFAMIFRALQQKGVLHQNAEGLAMGAGTERLIYAIARHARRVIVTDLYESKAGWKGVRTTDPKRLVLSKAPWPIEAGRIDAMTMDMRDLRYPDDTFDFCWSTGSFEHIGDDKDFRRHFEEVHRVLRPGGVYAFTTAVIFGERTLPIPHNYYFHPEHLIDLLHESPLHAEPEFDCHVTDHLFNRPHMERFQDYGFPAGLQISKPVISFRRGALLAANVMVLTKEPGRRKQRPVVTGYDATCRRLRRQADNLTEHLWKDYQVLRPEPVRNGVFVQPQYFGQGRIAIDVMLGPGAARATTVIVKSRDIMNFRDWRVDRCAAVTVDTCKPIEIMTDDSRIYSVTVDGVQAAAAERIVIRAKRVNDSAQAPGDSKPIAGTVRPTLRDRLTLLRRALS